MLTRWTLRSALVVAALASFEVASSAQFIPRSCPRIPGEGDTSWQIRCAAQEREEVAREEEERTRDASRRSAAMMERLRETERQRAILEKQPPLPAARNRLLGRWQSATSRPGPSGDPFAQLLTMVSGCGVLIGDGIVEFEPARWAIYDGDGRNDLGAVSYRGGANGAVFVLPAKGSDFSLLPFEFETPDRIHLTSTVCTLVRTNAAVPPGSAGGPAAPSSRAAAAKPAASAPTRPAASAPAPPAAATGLRMMKDRIGYQCADGQQLAVESCFSDANDADCSVVRVDLPPRNGFEVRFIENRGVLIKRVASCTERSLVIRDGALALVP